MEIDTKDRNSSDSVTLKAHKDWFSTKKVFELYVKADLVLPACCNNMYLSEWHAFQCNISKQPMLILSI